MFHPWLCECTVQTCPQAFSTIVYIHIWMSRKVISYTYNTFKISMKAFVYSIAPNYISYLSRGSLWRWELSFISDTKQRKENTNRNEKLIKTEFTLPLLSRVLVTDNCQFERHTVVALYGSYIRQFEEHCSPLWWVTLTHMIAHDTVYPFLLRTQIVRQCKPQKKISGRKLTKV